MLSLYVLFDRRLSSALNCVLQAEVNLDAKYGIFGLSMVTVVPCVATCAHRAWLGSAPDASGGLQAGTRQSVPVRVGHVGQIEVGCHPAGRLAG